MAVYLDCCNPLGPEGLTNFAFSIIVVNRIDDEESIDKGWQNIAYFNFKGSLSKTLVDHVDKCWQYTMTALDCSLFVWNAELNLGMHPAVELCLSWNVFVMCCKCNAQV